MQDKINVLIVDDQKTMRKIVRQLLSQQGFKQVTEAEDGAEALRLMEIHEHQENAFDVIICDLYMDGMDGLQFANALRRAKINTPILILTGESDIFMHGVTKQAGATKVLVKPISGSDLAREIEAAVGFALAV